MITPVINAENIATIEEFEKLSSTAIYCVGELNEKLANAEISYEVCRINFPQYFVIEDKIFRHVVLDDDIKSRYTHMNIEVYFSNEKPLVTFEFRSKTK